VLADGAIAGELEALSIQLAGYLAHIIAGTLDAAANNKTFSEVS